MRCPYCDQEHSVGIRFCPLTGREILQPAVCPGCGRQIDPKWQHCGHCGRKLIQVVANDTPPSILSQEPPQTEKLAPKPPRSAAGHPKKLQLIILGGIGGLLITAYILLTILWGGKQQPGTDPSAPTGLLKTQPVAEAPGGENYPSTKNPQCGTIVTLVDRSSWLFGETNIPFDMKGISYQGIIVSDNGLMEVSGGTLEELSISKKPITLASKDLQGGYVHTDELGDFKVMSTGNLNSVCILLVASPEQVDKIIQTTGELSIVPTSQTQKSEDTPATSGAQKMSEKDGMIQLFVPEGEFGMGSTETEAAQYIQQCIAQTSSAELVIGSEEQIRSDCENKVGSEKPKHTVWLDGFWIDQTEVTHGMYTACVKEGKCIGSQYAGDANLNDPNQPVIGVDWANASTYCTWAGRRLPTEAEWEKAARGTDGRTYPWGNQPPDPQLTNFLDMGSKTSKVGSYPGGSSPYGVLDMAGNVVEWVADWYDETYYGISPDRNPQGPDTGEFRGLRGGFWGWTQVLDVRTAFR